MLEDVTYAPTTHRFVAVLNKKYETGRLMNTLAHMTIAITHSHMDNLDSFAVRTYEDGDGGLHPNLSGQPFIVLRADNSNQIKTLKSKLQEKSIKYVDFVHTMILKSAEEQVEITKQTKEEDLDYLGICFFADYETAKELTKKFSTFK